METETNAEGRYAFRGMAPGTYTLEAIAGSEARILAVAEAYVAMTGERPGTRSPAAAAAGRARSRSGRPAPGEQGDGGGRPRPPRPGDHS